MKLSTKVVIIFSVVTIFLGSIGLVPFYVNKSLKDELLISNKNAIQEVKLMDEMGLELYGSITNAQYLLIEQYSKRESSVDLDTSRVPAGIVRHQIEEAINDFRANLVQSKKLIKEHHKATIKDSTETASVMDLFNKLEKKVDIYVSLLQQFQKFHSGKYSDGRDFLNGRIEPFFRTALLPLMAQVRSGIQRNLQKNTKRLNTRFEQLSSLFIMATIFAIAVALLLAFYLYRSITEPIHKISRTTQNISKGNLDDRIDYNRDDELGRLSATINSVAENLDQTTISRDYVDGIIESVADLLVVTNQEFEVTRINSAGLLMLGKTKAQVLGKNIKAFVESADNLASNADQNGRMSETLQNFSGSLLAEEGKVIPVHISKGTLKGHSAETEGYVIVAGDISDQKEAQSKIEKSLKEKKLLLSEIHHRVKNNLAVISGLLQMQIWDVENDSVAKALQESQLRISSIALVHEKLYRSETLSSVAFDSYLDDLLQTIADIYRSDNSDIVLETAFNRLEVDISQAIPCALLVNELVINAFEHAFKNQKEGIIKVSMEKLGDKITFQVKDNGCGFSGTTPNADSLGMTLINTLSKQLEGEINFEDNEGLEVTVVFNRKELEGTKA